MVAEPLPFVSTYLVWFLASAAVVPLFRLCGLPTPESWLAARTLGVALPALAALHIARWMHTSLGPAVVATCIIAAVLNILMLSTWRRLVSDLHRPQIRSFIIRSEVLTLAGTLLLVGVFGVYYGPHSHGERPMDLGLVNGLMHCSRFPPEHFWAAGKTLHYYYFGSLIAAVLGKLSRVDGHFAYFHFLVIVWVQTAIAGWLCARTLGARRTGMWLGPICLILLGTAAPLYQWQQGISPFSGAALVKSLRVIPGTINEVPPTAFWASELHAHVMALPFMATLMLFVVHTVRSRCWISAAMLGTTAAMLLMTDAWQVPGIAVAALLLAAAVLLSQRRNVGFAIIALPVAVVLALLFASAMWVGYEGPAVRFRFVAQTTTRWLHLLVLFGPVCAVVAFAWLAGARAPGHVRRIPIVAALLVAAALTLLVCELGYMDMGLPSPAERQNTVMRLHWTAYFLLAMAAPAAARRFRPNLVSALAASTILFFSLVNLLPAVGSWRAAAKNLRWTTDVRQGLDPSHTGIGQIAEYLGKSVPTGAVIAESAGHPYRGFALVSAMCGRPAVFGEIDKLNNHGIAAAESVQRFNDLSTLYADSLAASAVVRKYNIEYVVLGPAERQAYAKIDTQGLLARYRFVAKRGQVTLLATTADETSASY
ncbi:MAG: DUF2298 domain-containing protein [Candidatus Sumerlaeaceae bacterium]